MKKHMQLIALFFFVCLLSSIGSSLDSLQLAANKQTGTEQIETLITVATYQTEEALPDALKTLQQAMQMAEKQKDPLWQAKVLHQKGLVYDKNLQDEKALTFYMQALSAGAISADADFLLSVYNAISHSYFYLNKIDSSRLFISKVLQLHQQTPNHKEAAIAYRTLGNIMRRTNNTDSTLYYYQGAAEASAKADDKDGSSRAFNSIGVVYFSIQQYDSALHYYKAYFHLREAMEDPRGAAIGLTNIGNVHHRTGNYSEAIVNYNKALVYFQEIHFLEGIGTCYNNIATIYENLVVGDFYQENLNTFKQALTYHENALQTRKEQGNQQQIAYSLNNMGTIHYKIEETELQLKFGKEYKDSILSQQKEAGNCFEKSLQYYQQAYEIQETLGNKAGVASTLSNIGRIYFTRGEYERSIELFNQSVELSREVNNRHELSLGLFQLGLSYNKLNDREKGLALLRQALRIAYEIDNKELKKSCYENISEIKESLSLYQAALDNYKRFKRVNDSLFNEETSRIINEIRTQYETEKQEQLNVQLQLENNLARQQNRMQRLIIMVFILVLVIIAGFMILIYRQYQQIKKTNKLLEEKNELISEQKQEITDSIQYASRIQTAMLPPEELLNKLMQPDYFILYRPRDIVSGDYYWATEHNNKTILVAADCTGHGVPGAFMSMLGIAFLNEIVNQKENISAAEILNQLREHIITSLHQTGETGTSQDGMDMAICIINKEKNELEYAGANNPLVMIRDNEIIQYKPDKMPVGIYVKANIPFSSQTIPIQKDDCIYIFSDGYQDQFGGPNGKKFMIKNMKDLFLAIHKKPMSEQKEVMEQTLTQWMEGTGEQYEAIDDVIVMGIRI